MSRVGMDLAHGMMRASMLQMAQWYFYVKLKIIRQEQKNFMGLIQSHVKDNAKILTIQAV